MAPTDELRDRIELRELVERYAMGADARDRDGFGAVFTPDGRLVIAANGVTFEGRAAIVATLDYLDEHYPRSMHFVGNHQVDVAGDRASGVTYCLAHHYYVSDGVERDTKMVIRYLDEYQRTGDGWCIASRTLTMDWQEDRPITMA